MLEKGVAENHPELAARCLDEALFFVVEPFISVLKELLPKAMKARGAHHPRVVAVLQLLRERSTELEELEELEPICHELVNSQDAATREIAEEISPTFTVRGVENQKPQQFRIFFC